MKLSEIRVRDPFILPFNGVYYLYCARTSLPLGFQVYTSTDLENWTGPTTVFEYTPGFWGTKDYWAPEVHRYNDKFYLFATFKGEDVSRGTAILIADSPMGPFVPHSDGAVTPKDWESLDGTLYIDEDGQPWMVFCHEWLQIHNGTVCAIKLSADLSRAVSEPVELWRAGDAPWVRYIDAPGKFVTDGPFLFHHDGKLMSLWSSFDKDGYVEAVACSDNGRIDGNWSVDFPPLLHGKDSGHGMLFTTFEGQWKFICHQPNTDPNERPTIYRFDGNALTQE